MGRNNTYDGLAPALFRAPTAKTASYYMVPEDIGTIFTNRGASGAVVLTLPDTDDIDIGWFVELFTVAAQDFSVKSFVVDTMVAFNDAAADQVGFETSGEQIGGGIKCTWDGTGWLTQVSLGLDSQTPTIAT